MTEKMQARRMPSLQAVFIQRFPYINKDSKSANVVAKLLELIGADFKRQFSLESYKDFFKKWALNP